MLALFGILVYASPSICIVTLLVFDLCNKLLSLPELFTKRSDIHVPMPKF